jgi:hypothetical protein
MSNEAEFRFEMWAVTRPDDAYYYTNWDNKTPITVVATNEQAAFKSAKGALGEAPRHHYWVFRVLNVTDHRIPEEAR